ncbi:cation:proton antiporter [Gleimia hominis]|uniref:cation:proton antiporter n=1 Tax=Gleimia hominis TaxID=595468 RepID=UPI0033064AE0
MWALARKMTWGAIKTQLSTIASLSIALVFVTIGVLTGLILWLLPVVGVAGAIVLAAALAPPDPVAVDAIAVSAGIPRRITSTLSTEGLFNDAASIVTFNLGLNALLAGSELSLADGIKSFLWAVVAAVILGLAVGRAAAWFSDHVNNVTARNALTWVLPFAVYAVAEHIEASGVIAVVIVAIELTSRARLSAADRLSGAAFWDTIEMLFTGVAFGLIGLSVSAAIDEIGTELWHAALVGLVLGVAVIIVRFIWMLIATKINQRRKRCFVAPLDIQEVLVMTWGGMRGLVTLALALSIPASASATLHHEASVISLVFLVVTMVIPGLTLPSLMRTLNLNDTTQPIDDLQKRARKAAANYILEKKGRPNSRSRQEAQEELKNRFARYKENSERSKEDRKQLIQKTKELRIGALKAAQDELLRARNEPGIEPGAIAEILDDLDHMILATRN